MKKNLFLSIVLAIAMMLGIGTLAACSDDDDDDFGTPSGSGTNQTTTVESKLYEDGTIYCDGEQTITLGFTLAENTTQANFKDSITASDITLTGVLAGKTVKSVTYENSTKVTVVVDNKVTATGSQSNEKGKITVSKNAVSTNKAYSCTTDVDFDPQMYCRTVTAERGNYRSYFYLPYGLFIEANATEENIVFSNLNADATVNIRLNDAGGLVITVQNFTSTTESQYPVATIGANVTTFNKVFTVNIGEKCTLSVL